MKGLAAPMVMLRYPVSMVLSDGCVGNVPKTWLLRIERRTTIREDGINDNNARRTFQRIRGELSPR